MSTRPLHQKFPQLAGKLPHISLASLPTPLVTRPLGQRTLLAKLDGRTSSLYGGNKVRKLEYLLAQAQQHGCSRVATFGAAGSNHATATAVHAHALGLRCTTFLSRQRTTPWVAENLRRQLKAQADIVFVEGTRNEREHQARQWTQACADRVWQIPMGGSSVAGAIGYVNAGLELGAQLRETDPPDRIYVPLGTMGTAVGLAVGLSLAKRRIPVHAVRVVHESVGSASSAVDFFAQLVRLLRTLDPSLPELAFDPGLFQVRNEFFGAGYAHATDASIVAFNHARDLWDLKLETTYSAKTLAAVLADQCSVSAPERPLLWCTYSDQSTQTDLDNEQLARLPTPLHHYLHEQGFGEIPN